MAEEAKETGRGKAGKEEAPESRKSRKKRNGPENRLSERQKQEKRKKRNGQESGQQKKKAGKKQRPKTSKKKTSVQEEIKQTYSRKEASRTTVSYRRCSCDSCTCYLSGTVFRQKGWCICTDCDRMAAKQVLSYDVFYPESFEEAYDDGGVYLKYGSVENGDFSFVYVLGSTQEDMNYMTESTDPTDLIHVMEEYVFGIMNDKQVYKMTTGIWTVGLLQ